MTLIAILLLTSISPVYAEESYEVKSDQTYPNQGHLILTAPSYYEGWEFSFENREGSTIERHVQIEEKKVRVSDHFSTGEGATSLSELQDSINIALGVMGHPPILGLRSETGEYHQSEMANGYTWIIEDSTIEPLGYVEYVEIMVNIFTKVEDFSTTPAEGIEKIYFEWIDEHGDSIRYDLDSNEDWHVFQVPEGTISYTIKSKGYVDDDHFWIYGEEWFWQGDSYKITELWRNREEKEIESYPLKHTGTLEIDPTMDGHYLELIFFNAINEDLNQFGKNELLVGFRSRMPKDPWCNLYGFLEGMESITLEWEEDGIAKSESWDAETLIDTWGELSIWLPEGEVQYTVTTKGEVDEDHYWILGNIASYRTWETWKYRQEAEKDAFPLSYTGSFIFSNNRAPSNDYEPYITFEMFNVAHEDPGTFGKYEVTIQTFSSSYPDESWYENPSEGLKNIELEWKGIDGSTKSAIIDATDLESWDDLVSIWIPRGEKLHYRINTKGDTIDNQKWVVGEVHQWESSGFDTSRIQAPWLDWLLREDDLSEETIEKPYVYENSLLVNRDIGMGIDLYEVKASLTEDPEDPHTITVGTYSLDALNHIEFIKFEKSDGEIKIIDDLTDFINNDKINMLVPTGATAIRVKMKEDADYRLRSIEPIQAGNFYAMRESANPEDYPLAHDLIMNVRGSLRLDLDFKDFDRWVDDYDKDTPRGIETKIIEVEEEGTSETSQNPGLGTVIFETIDENGEPVKKEGSLELKPKDRIRIRVEIPEGSDFDKVNEWRLEPIKDPGSGGGGIPDA